MTNEITAVVANMFARRGYPENDDLLNENRVLKNALQDAIEELENAQSANRKPSLIIRLRAALGE